MMGERGMGKRGLVNLSLVRLRVRLRSRFVSVENSVLCDPIF